MSNFLRKLRRNNVKKSDYFKYAFGEIILVVVGILIALGINNLNEERQISKQEMILLQKVKTENEFNINILSEDTALFYAAQNNAIELAQSLKLPATDRRDSMITNNLINVLQIVNMEFSDEYLSRYINSSENQSDQLVFDFIELNDNYKSVKISSDMVADFKLEKIITTLESGMDFLEGTITDLSVIDNQIFYNRLIILSAIEVARADAVRECIVKAYKIDSLLNAKLNN